MKFDQQKYRMHLCPELTVTPIVCGSDIETDEGAGIQIGLQICQISGAVEVLIRLRLDFCRLISFIGIELDPLNLTGQDAFLGETPGFLEKSGVVLALTAQSEGRESSLFALLSRPGRISCLAGIGALHDDPSAFSLVDGRLRAGFRPERVLDAGEYEFKLLLGFDSDPLELARRYGNYLTPLGRTGKAKEMTGWNSWDFYGGAVSMADIEQEISALNKMKCRNHLNYLTIDMGWEEAWGDWRPNRKFPETLKEIADKIRTAGWHPGIWFAPFQVGMFTPLARHRQELFLRDETGALIIVNDEMPTGPVLLLDYSLPEVREIVNSLFSNAHEAGFELFKIDYLYERFLAKATSPAVKTGKAAFARLIFQTIREAIGNEACLVNCGGRKESALGFADTCRVSTDIHNFWGHIRNNARQIAGSFWMHHRLWLNDPDFAITRHSGNCHTRYLNMPYSTHPLSESGDFWMRGSEASMEELKLWLAVVRLNGGPIFLSDSIRDLLPDGRKTLERLFPPLQSQFDPLDLFERRYPGIWLSRDSSRPTLGLFNWEDTPQTLELPSSVNGPLSCREFWSGKKIKLSGEVHLAPRSGLLLDL
jgi:hypothetical protein